MWARKYEKCKSCGTVSAKHRARGLCKNCYHKDIECRHKRHRRGLRIAASKLSREYLIQKYLREQLSLSEIAQECGCSRQYVFKKMREHGLVLRNRQNARRIALEQRKIEVRRTDDAGDSRAVIFRKIKYNSEFFEKWTPAMAYVLGIIFTDGNLQERKTYDATTGQYTRMARLSIAQKEPELLRKVLALMNCDARLYFQARKEYSTTVAGQLYHFSIASNELYHTLSAYGLKPKKSLDIRFPLMPDEYVRHFVRGCWDGDGSVYVERRSNRLVASYVSGSKVFITELAMHLEKAGLPRRTIYEENRRHSSYYIKYAGDQCTKLYHYLYDNVPPTQYLERKYQLFNKHCDNPRGQTKFL